MESPYELRYVHVVAGTDAMPTATVRIRRPDGLIVPETATGPNAVEAVFNAIDRFFGTEAVFWQNVRYCYGGDRWHCRGQSQKTSIIVSVDQASGIGEAEDANVAAAQAYMNAVNKLIGREQPTSRPIGELVPGI